MAKKKTPIAAKSKKGGRRAGAGRKAKPANLLRQELLDEADRLICKNLPRLIENMLVLANGGYPRVEEKWEPDLVLSVDPETGKSKQSVEMKLVERKVSFADRDRAANIYLIDRMLGRAKQAVEVSGKDGGAIVHLHAATPLKLLPDDDLDALERIAEHAARLALGGPVGDAQGGPGGAVPALPG